MNFLKELYKQPRMKSIRKKIVESDRKRKKLSHEFEAIRKKESARLKSKNSKKTKSSKSSKKKNS